MTRTAIIYASTHHGNTKKLAEAIARCHDITLIDAAVQPNADLTDFDLIGFASGIDFGKFYPAVERFLSENLPENKDIFFLYTCAKSSNRFTMTIRASAAGKKAVCLGEY